MSSTGKNTKSSKRENKRPVMSELRYRVLADQLEAMIVAGDYRVGERLPSVRTIHQQGGLAIGTICQALAELEARALVEARPRSGYFVINRRTFVAPTTKPSKARPQRVPLPHLTDEFVAASADKSLVSFGGTKSPDCLTAYGPPAGDLSLRREISKLLLGIGIAAASESIVVTSGCMNAMRLAISVATKPGDVVAVESPTFFALLPMLRDAGLLVAEIATDSMTGLNIDMLEQVAVTRRIAAVIVTPHFHNPTGACMHIADKQRLLAVSRKHGFAIIEDDVYGDLYFGVSRPRPIAAIAARTDNIFYCSSFSKTLAAGLRIGFVVCAASIGELTRAKLANTISSPVLNQLIVAQFLRSGSYQRHLRKLRTSLRSQVAATTAAIANYFPGVVQVTAPTGGFFLWMRLPDHIDSRELYDKAMREGISILPGDVCAIDDRFRHNIRLSCGSPWSPVLEKALKRLGALMQSC
jgi:DNA-binding transcriptional MocR family regulator